MWADELGAMSLQQIKYALDIVVDNFPEWPPTIGEFKKLCKLAEIEPDYKPAQIDNPTKPETFISALDAMKAALK